MTIEMPTYVKEQAFNVLSMMGPYSIEKFLWAIDNGKVDGTYYTPWDCETYTDPQGTPYTEGNFVGCMLGWAGFLEGIPIFNNRMSDRTTLHFQMRSRGISSFTNDLEFGWVKEIHEGDTPETNEYLAELKMVVLEYRDTHFPKITIPVLVEEPELITA